MLRPFCRHPCCLFSGSFPRSGHWLIFVGMSSGRLLLPVFLRPKRNEMSGSRNMKPSSCFGPNGLAAAMILKNRVGLPKIVNMRSCVVMPSPKQSNAARQNIKKAAAAAKRKQTLKHLPKKTRTALGRQAAKVRKEKQGR